MYILGISAYYHDSAATLIENENILAAAQEERFTRIKHDSSFPKEAIKYCIRQEGISLEDISYIAFYDKPFIKFERLLETYLSEAPRGLRSFLMAIPIWLKDKLFLKETLIREFVSIYAEQKEQLTRKEKKKFKSQIMNKLMFSEHHQSHAASAFYPSPYKESAILTIDGVGEWATTTISYGKENKINFLKEIHFPHSLGLLYSAFTYYIGFKVNSGEYKLMGLAPYGKPKYVNLIKDKLIDVKHDGSFRLNMKYFNFTHGLTMTGNKFHELFGSSPRKNETEIKQKHMDIAASIQQVTEEIVLKLALHAKKITESQNLCLAGGVALNCVANGKILRSNTFKNIWIQPAAGDAGGSLGAAFSVYYDQLKNKRILIKNKIDSMKGSYLGPKFNNNECKKSLDKLNAKYEYFEDFNLLINEVSEQLALGKIVGWFQGRMEFGPRSLGNRSIIGDPRSKEMQSNMNLKIKYRESFRPFAPSVLAEKKNLWFDLDKQSPYMLLVSQVKKNKLKSVKNEHQKLTGLEKINIIRSQIPAVTHVDLSARVQTVDKDINPKYHQLISKFEEKTGCPLIVNTSFNVRGEPIVCTPEDSYRCFMSTELDLLIMNNFLLLKKNQYEIKDNIK